MKDRTIRELEEQIMYLGQECQTMAKTVKAQEEMFSQNHTQSESNTGLSSLLQTHIAQSNELRAEISKKDQ